MFDFLKDLGAPPYLAGGLGLLMYAIKKYLEIKKDNLKTTKSQLDALIDTMTDEKKSKEKFIVEQVFSYKFKTSIPYSVISILLNTENPSLSISDYIKGRMHLDIDKNGNRFVYKTKIKKIKYRKIWKIIYNITYLCFAVPSALLFAIAPSMWKNAGLMHALVILVFALSLFIFAYFSLHSGTSIIAAERIMEQFQTKSKLSN